MGDVSGMERWLQRRPVAELLRQIRRRRYANQRRLAAAADTRGKCIHRDVQPQRDCGILYSIHAATLSELNVVRRHVTEGSRCALNLS